MALQVTRLDGPGALAEAAALGAVLADCVEGGASVNFMHPFGPADGEAFFREVAAKVAQGKIALLAARLDGELVGTVQLNLDTPPNQRHRADVNKMLVRRPARKAGVGAALMKAVEDLAASLGRTLLVLDTVQGEAGERLYERMGWRRGGAIPDYALYPDGRPCATVLFWKRVGI